MAVEPETYRGVLEIREADVGIVRLPFDRLCWLGLLEERVGEDVFVSEGCRDVVIGLQKLCAVGKGQAFGGRSSQQGCVEHARLA